MLGTSSRQERSGSLAVIETPARLVLQQHKGKIKPPPTSPKKKGGDFRSYEDRARGPGATAGGVLLAGILTPLEVIF